MPKTVKDAPCQEVVRTDGGLDELPVLTTWPEDGGPFITLAARDHSRSRNRHAEHRNVPHAGVRPPDHGHALAASQGRGTASPRGGAARQAPRSGGRARRRSGPPVLGHRADAGGPRRIDAGRRPLQAQGRVGQVPHDRSRSARAGPDRSRGLRRTWRKAPRRVRSAITPACTRWPTIFRCFT